MPLGYSSTPPDNCTDTWQSVRLVGSADLSCFSIYF